MNLKRITAYVLLILGFVAIIFQSGFGCLTMWLGRPHTYLERLSIPCITISVIIGLALMFIGTTMLKKST